MQNTITKPFSKGSDPRVEYDIVCPITGQWEIVKLDTRSGEAEHPCGAFSDMDAETIRQAVSE